MKKPILINETFSQTYKDKFFDYVKDNNLKKVNSYLMNGMNPNQVNQYNNAPLFVSTKHLEVFKLLLDYNANSQITNKTGNLLHVASFEANLKVIEYIIDVLKFDVNLLSNEGKPPIQYVMQSWKSTTNDNRVEKMMILKGAKLELVNFKHDSAFFDKKIVLLKDYQLAIEEKSTLEDVLNQERVLASDILMPKNKMKI